MSKAAHPNGQQKFGPILLASGVSRSDVLFYLLTHGILACLASFIGLVQPYVLTEVMHIPRSEQGVLTGNLVGAQQLALLLFLLVFGAFADRFGRRVFMIAAAAGMTLTILFYPLATGVVYLLIARFVFGLGVASHSAGSNAMRMDLPDNNSRGRFSALLGITNVVLTAVFVSYLGTHLPSWFKTRGVSPADAGAYTFWLIAVLGAIAFVAAVFGLKKDGPPSGAKFNFGQNIAFVVASIREVLSYAKANRRFRMMLLLSPIVRSDSVILATFLSLWIMTAGAHQGLDSAEAMRTVGLIAMVVGVTDIVALIVMGFLADRFDRLKMLVCCIALTTVSFSTPLWVSSVTGIGILAVVAFIQLVEGATSASAFAFLGEETPAHLRGATSSVFSWLGHLSGMIVGIAGGWLFDKAGYAAPFLLISVLAAAWLAFALIQFGRRAGVTSIDVRAQ